MRLIPGALRGSSAAPSPSSRPPSGKGAAKREEGKEIGLNSHPSKISLCLPPSFPLSVRAH